MPIGSIVNNESGSSVRSKLNALIDSYNGGTGAVPAGGAVGQVLTKTGANDYALGWSALPDYATRIYATRADLVAAKVPVDIQVVGSRGYASAGDGGGAEYRRASVQSTGPGKVQSADGMWWEPIPHDGITPLVFGAKGDGATDDHAAIADAVAFAAAYGVAIDGGGLSYATSATVGLGATGITLRRMTLVALAGFAAGTPVVNVAGANVRIASVDVDAAHTADVGLYLAADGCHIRDCTITHFNRAGFKTSSKATDTRTDNVFCFQYLWGETGWNNAANRSAYGFWIRCYDTIISNCGAAYSAIPLFVDTINSDGVTAPGSIQILGGHYYNGGATTGTSDIALKITPGAGVILNGVVIDNGKLQIAGLGGNNWEAIVSGCRWLKSANGQNTTAIELVTGSAATTARGLVISGGTFPSSITPVALTTTGSGTWAAQPEFLMFGNGRGQGSATPPDVYGQWVVKGGAAGSPAVASHDDTSTGLYFPSAHTIGLSAGGAITATFGNDGTSRTATVGNGYGQSYIAANGADQQNLGYQFEAGGILRWAVLRDNTLIGSLAINRYDAAGAYQDTPLKIAGNTGAVVIAGAYSQPLYFGSNALWVDASGKLRIKNGPPASDTDGTVVGAQS